MEKTFAVKLFILLRGHSSLAHLLLHRPGGGAAGYSFSPEPPSPSQVAGLSLLAHTLAGLVAQLGAKMDSSPFFLGPTAKILGKDR